MRLRKLILASLLIAIGFILHTLSPGFFFGMRPDLSLAALFVAILVVDDFKVSLVAGIAVGIISALTTTFPMGQLPNIIDKFVTTFVVLAIIYVLSPVIKKRIFLAGFIGFIGTLVSGTVFLGSALAIAGLPAPFGGLFVTVVIPAAIANTICTAGAYALVQLSQKAVKPKYVSQQQ